MSIYVKLSPEKQRQLDAEVAAGRFSSVEAALDVALDNLLPGNEDELGWTRAYLDAARSGAVAAEHTAIDDVRASLSERILRLAVAK